MGFCCFSEQQIEKKRKQKDRRILGYCIRAEKVVEHEGNGDTNSSWCTWNGPQRSRKETGRNGNQKKNRDYPVHCVVQISKNTEKSHGDLRKPVTPVKDHKLNSSVKNESEQSRYLF